MSPIAAHFVIIMNDDLESSYMQWRVVHRDATLADARLHNQYASAIASFPRNRYKAAIVEAKTLVHTPSGIVKWGAIYKLSERVARVRIKRSAATAEPACSRIKVPARGSKAHLGPLGRISAGLDDNAFAPLLVGKKGKPGGWRAFAPPVNEKTSRSPKRRKIGT
jgi:hypothetical protein